MAASPPVVTAPSEWLVAVEIRPGLLALADEAARQTGRPLEQIITEAVGAYLRANPVSLR